MRRSISVFVAGVALLSIFMLTENCQAYYYPPTNIPPGPPPNYNPVDVSYFLGTPILPYPPPNDSGGFYVYYDQGTWCVVNHIYCPGGALDQFHGSILAIMDQPPVLGTNVFIQELELWGDVDGYKCLQQNDRWGWYPWGDNLYEIWWDFSTKEWINNTGDPNDYICFKIIGCAVDFNLWSSGLERPLNEFTISRIWLGAEKTLLSSIPGFSDTYPGLCDDYQTAVGDPRTMPNTTIFTFKESTPRSYNIHGLINCTDSYSCRWACEYGKRYAGSFVYEGNGAQFSVNLCPSNRDPQIFITPDTSLFLCDGDSVKIWIYASDPDAGDIITVEKISGAGNYTPQTGASPFSDEFYFHPDTSGVYDFIFRATDKAGATDEDTSLVTVKLNRPPELTCPEDGMVIGGNTFVSSDYSVSDPDGDPTPVIILDIDPSATNDPTIVNGHVEWVTTPEEEGDYTIRLIATDPCEASDICEFTVTVVNEPTGEFDCPDDGSVHAGDLFVSTNYTLTYPDCELTSVEILDITPSATHNPVLVGYHVEWQTTCQEDGDYVIRLITGEDCSVQDTCSFTVTVYNHPPELTCPDNGEIPPQSLFISTDFHFYDPDGDDVTVFFAKMIPPALHVPIIVENHVEWNTECASGEYIIILVVVDSCGLVDTCEFVVNVTRDPLTDFSLLVDPHAARTFSLFQNMPNPFNPETNISYYLPKDCQVNVNIYNLLGQKIRTLFDGYQSTGIQTRIWNGRSDLGEQLSSGIYFYRLQADNYVETKKMTLMK
jgi:hypothetical protein